MADISGAFRRAMQRLGNLGPSASDVARALQTTARPSTSPPPLDPRYAPAIGELRKVAECLTDINNPPAGIAPPTDEDLIIRSGEMFSDAQRREALQRLAESPPLGVPRTEYSVNGSPWIENASFQSGDHVRERLIDPDGSMVDSAGRVRPPTTEYVGVSSGRRTPPPPPPPPPPRRPNGDIGQEVRGVMGTAYRGIGSHVHQFTVGGERETPVRLAHAAPVYLNATIKVRAEVAFRPTPQLSQEIIKATEKAAQEFFEREVKRRMDPTAEPVAPKSRKRNLDL